MTKPISRQEFLKLAGGATAGLALNWIAGKDIDLSNPAMISGTNNTFRKSTKAPNVLLIVMDTVRAKSTSLYGYEKQTTPELDKLSARGVLFKTAITPCSWTLPAHASMFTGQWPSKLSTHYITPLDTIYPVLAEVMSANGYTTAGFVANTFYCSREFGLSRGFQHYEDYRVSAGQALMSEALISELILETHLYESLATYDNLGRKSAEMVNQDFLKWLGKQKADRPFWAFLNYFDAHEPYLPPAEFVQQYGLKRPYGHITEDIRASLSFEAIRELNQAYDGSIQYVDQQVGSLLETLTQKNVLDDTLVIITSDHGEAFGEHQILEHGNSLYLEVIHVPLLIIYPNNVPEGKICNTPVSLRDIPATIMDLTGISAQSIFPGLSLSRYWEAIDANEEMLYSQTVLKNPGVSKYKYSLESILYQDFHYIQPYQQDVELYQFKTDPGELRNLANDPGYQEVLARYQVYLKNVRSEA
jgi:arylsulfatase A-like enzyme